MVYYIYINKGLDNEQLYPDVYTDRDKAVAMVNALKKFDTKAQTICTGVYKDGRYVRTFCIAPIDLMFKYQM